MSKKSRKKQKPEEISSLEEEALPSSGEESEVTEDDQTAPVATVDHHEEGELPESVAPGALEGEPAHGEAPKLSLIVEAILFASQKAVSTKELATHLRNAAAAAADPTSPALAHAKVKEGQVHEALVELQAEVAATGRAYQVRETATGWLLSSGPGYAPWLRALYPEAKPTRLSASALETLAIIAYRQPITRADMEAVRGVSVDGVMQTLLDRGLVKIAGRSESAGRPLLYSTTQHFLDHFGLRHLDELPNAAELRHLPLPRAEGSVEESSPELPVVGEEGQSSVDADDANETMEVTEITEITEIIEVRESVVFDEIAFDAPAGDPSVENGAADAVGEEEGESAR